MAWQLASLFQDKCEFSRVTEILSRLIWCRRHTVPGIPVAAYREPIFDGNTGKWHVVYTESVWSILKIMILSIQDVSWNTLPRSITGTTSWAEVVPFFFSGFPRVVYSGRATLAVVAGLRYSWRPSFNHSPFCGSPRICVKSRQWCSLFWGSNSDIGHTFHCSLVIFAVSRTKERSDRGDGLILSLRDASRQGIRVASGKTASSGLLYSGDRRGTQRHCVPRISRNEPHARRGEEEEERPCRPVKTPDKERRQRDQGDVRGRDYRNNSSVAFLVT
jgi:hypothetical protein